MALTRHACKLQLVTYRDVNLNKWIEFPTNLKLNQHFLKNVDLIQKLRGNL